MTAETKNKKPVAVLISDVHYNTTTLPVADQAMNMAIDKANALQIPLVVAGDLHDTKANLRGECVKVMIATFKRAKVPVYISVGNHCKINEKGKDHSLEFLRPYVTKVVDEVEYIESIDSFILPYYSDAEELHAFLQDVPESMRLIMHQGVMGADMGHYVQDKTSLPREAFANLRVISGHYHKTQDIKCGRPRKGAVGLFSYIGNPYTLTFGEAKDGPKGFQILYSDGLLEQVPTNLRKHVIIETTVDAIDEAGTHGADPFPTPGPQDLVWLKVKGPLSTLQALNKKELGQMLLGHSNFKLDLIPTDSATLDEKAGDLKDTEVLDKLIDAMGETKERKEYLKALWREIV